MKKIAIKDITEIRTGFQVRSRLTSIDQGTHNIIQMRNISLATGQILTDTTFCRVTPKERSIDRYLLQAGELLLLTRGNRHPATLITEEFAGFVAAGQFMVLKLTTADCLPEYLDWCLNSSDAELYFKREARGTAVKLIDKGALEKFKISLPELSVQKNIVELAKLAFREAELLNSLKEKRQQLVYGYCKQKIVLG